MAEAFLGQIQMVGFNFAPSGWAQCDGQLMSISQNTALFSLLGTFYGGDGRTTFALPDLRGRLPIHQGQGPGLSDYVLGEELGEENVTLLSNQIPAHTHAVTTNCVSTGGDSTSPVGRVWSKDLGVQTGTYSANPNNATMSASAVTAAAAGGSQPHSNMRPYLTINFVIAVTGIFPSRN